MRSPSKRGVSSGNGHGTHRGTELHHQVKGEFSPHAGLVKVIEVLAESGESWEHAARVALAQAEHSVRNIKSIYVKDMQAVVEHDEIVAYRLTAKISFAVERERASEDTRPRTREEESWSGPRGEHAMGRMEEDRRQFNPEREEQRQYDQSYEDRELGSARRGETWRSREEAVSGGRGWGEQSEYGRGRSEMGRQGEWGEQGYRGSQPGQGWQPGQGSPYGRGSQFGQGSQYGQGWQGRERGDWNEERYGRGEQSYGGRGEVGRSYGYNPTGDGPQWTGGSRWSGEDIDAYRQHPGQGGRQYGGPADRSGWNPDYGSRQFGSDARYGRYGEQSYGRYNEPWEGSSQSSWRNRQDEDRGPGWGEQMQQFGGAMAGRMKRMFRSPKGYKRSDERIREDVCDQLAQSHIDPSEIELSVADGEVTLSGTVSERHMKWQAEQIIDNVGGVNEIHNQLRVRRSDQPANTNSTTQGTSMGGTPSTSSTGRNQARS